ncbi:PTR2-domain-containing protein [Backusella circina FSU 941]|nr:PTR2-domain-containing protein [Backusella circina FSU 941]
MLGAIMADQYIGRFKTILVFSLIYMIGWLILTCTALPSSLDAGGGFPGFIISLIIIGIGTGGIKGIVSAFCAGQYKFSENHTKKLKTGEIVLVDYDLSIQHMYNWFYWAINLGALLGGSICPFLEFSVGFYAAFLLPTCMFAVAILVFISGHKKYVKHAPTNSIIITAWRVISFAYHQSRILENKTARKHSDHFIDFAKRNSQISGVKEWSDDVSSRVTWDDTFVDELKQTMMACKIFFPLSIYWVCYSQLNNNLLSQAGVMNRPPGLPNDVMNNFDPIALIIFIPIIDLVFYPTLRKYNINFAPQKRITVGFMLAASSMAYAAIIQHFIYVDAQFISSGKANISVFWQVPCYLLLAFSEIFASITPMEYAYTHSPKSMKSFVSALSLWPTCISALISMAISPSAHDPNMVWVYGGVSITAFICGCLYYLIFGHYDKLDEENKEMKLSRRHKPIGTEAIHTEKDAVDHSKGE